MMKTQRGCFNESPSQKEGKFQMRRKSVVVNACLNESPSQKEGKFPPNPLQHCGAVLPQ